MGRERIVAVLERHREGKRTDVDLPLNITANEAIIGLNQAFGLGMDTSDLSRCFLRTENPIALLKGNRTLEEFGIRDGTVIHVI
ncbi:MAG TPA: EsaB/YukD family protein [Candidatus Mediterraneibacter avicola]|nr:EsaB/YukD family protein [Candidatus Mediterraneibacter avicola]